MLQVSWIVSLAPLVALAGLPLPLSLCIESYRALGVVEAGFGTRCKQGLVGVCRLHRAITALPKGEVHGGWGRSGGSAAGPSGSAQLPMPVCGMLQVCPARTAQSRLPRIL